jgi:arginyl-tRNA--protein-N-Asp/Glu arginylyltransferase
MRIALSECMPDYVSYTFPYHVWGFLDDGETAADALALGFLPVAYDMSRFYLARSIRIRLAAFSQTGRTRYVARRCAHIASRLVSRDQFDFTSSWQEMADSYFATRAVAADYRRERFFRMIESPFATHVMLLTDRRDEKPAGLTPVYLEEPVAEYGIPVYAPEQLDVSIGNHMMAEALRALQSMNCSYAYLGTCYSERDLYKTRFLGMEFFNGYKWSGDRQELHLFIDRQESVDQEHVLCSERYLEAFLDGDPAHLRKERLLWQVRSS